ncbi:hypothetical protein [Marinobacter sp. C2H3]|uniref:hypothetical protein n=1 Tax=Marinobacter sp. C2H3 TaxID=3119003 RepID=UPI00300E9BB8
MDYRRVSKCTLVMLCVLALAACDNGGSSGPGESPATDTVVLSLNTEVEVFPGDSIIDPAGDANIRVRHEVASNRKFVTLLSGSAELVRSGGAGG